MILFRCTAACACPWVVLCAALLPLQQVSTDYSTSCRGVAERGILRNPVMMQRVPLESKPQRGVVGAVHCVPERVPFLCGFSVAVNGSSWMIMRGIPFGGGLLTQHHKRKNFSTASKGFPKAAANAMLSTQLGAKPVMAENAVSTTKHAATSRATAF